MILWDGIFSCEDTFVLVPWICVAMLIRIRNQCRFQLKRDVYSLSNQSIAVIPADYSGQLTCLLRYGEFCLPGRSASRVAFQVQWCACVHWSGLCCQWSCKFAGTRLPHWLPAQKRQLMTALLVFPLLYILKASFWCTCKFPKGSSNTSDHMRSYLDDFLIQECKPATTMSCGAIFLDAGVHI